MQVVVITGSTRGIGYGLAHEFLKRGCAVVISGRSQESVDKAIEQLSKEHDTQKIHGFPCDVSNYEQLQGLWDATVERFSKVDYWVNNAGIGVGKGKIVDTPPEKLKLILDVNLLSIMYACKIAIQGMTKQGHGQIFNMEGLGSGGRKQDGMTHYGTTKYGLRYLTESLSKEVEGTGVKVGAISPGMVITDLIMENYDQNSPDWHRVKRFFNIAADKVETVTPWLAEKMLSNEKNGASYAWLTTPKMAWRFMTAAFNKHDLFAEE